MYIIRQLTKLPQCPDRAGLRPGPATTVIHSLEKVGGPLSRRTGRPVENIRDIKSNVNARTY